MFTVGSIYIKSSTCGCVEKFWQFWLCEQIIHSGIVTGYDSLSEVGP